MWKKIKEHPLPVPIKMRRTGAAGTVMRGFLIVVTPAFDEDQNILNNWQVVTRPTKNAKADQ